MKILQETHPREHLEACFYHNIHLVLKESRRAKNNLKKETVHDLRTAIRRCRTIAKALEEINPKQRLTKISKLSKKLFKSLGRLRDYQVMCDWAKVMNEEIGDSGKTLHLLEKMKKKFKKKAARALKKFKADKWEKNAWHLSKKGLVSEYAGCGFKPIAAGLLEEIFKASQIAEKSQSKSSYHHLRIAFKKFRYFLENFLPQIYQSWETDLKRIQDALGCHHELSLLQETLKAAGNFKEGIQARQKLQMEDYHRIFRGRNLWIVWRERLESPQVTGGVLVRPRLN